MNKIDKTVIDYIKRAREITKLYEPTEVTNQHILEIAKMIQDQEDNEKYWEEYK